MLIKTSHGSCSYGPDSLVGRTDIHLPHTLTKITNMISTIMMSIVQLLVEIENSQKIIYEYIYIVCVCIDFHAAFNVFTGMIFLYYPI
jgi:hypothetical protein